MKTPETPTTLPWLVFADAVSRALRMDTEETLALAKSKTGQSISSIPFLAGCEQPERTALAHVTVSVLASRSLAREVFDHRPSDDQSVLDRLATISHFEGADPFVITRGMK